MSLSSFGVRRPVVANLYMIAVIAAGIIFGAGLRREFFPEIRPNEVLVVAPYPGAAPDEVEEALAKKIEDAVADLRDIEEISTTVTEGLAVVRLEFEPGVRIEDAVAEVKRKVDALQDLPEQAERIVVDKFEPNLPVISLVLHGDAPERVMKEEAQRIRDDLRSLPGMGDVELAGVRTDEVAVEVRPEALLEHGLSLPTIADRVRQAMAELPGGAVKSSTETITIRTLGSEERAADIRNIVVKALPGGQSLRLGDVATVREGFVDADIYTRLDGEPAVLLTAFKVGEQDAVEIAEMVKAYAAGRLRRPIEPTLSERVKMLLRRPGDETPVSLRLAAYELGASRTTPPPGEITLINDLARFITQRLDLLGRNAFWGAIFVFLTLVLLLNVRAAVWVVVGLVVAIFGTLVVMRIADITLNLLSMFGLIIVVGMLVDDGIVIVENIVAHHERGRPPMEAAIEGAQEVQWPVVGTVTTTIVAFMPMLMIKGRIGDMLGTLPWVVAVALGVSLIEALFSLPKHMAHSLARTERLERTGRTSALRRLENRFDRARERVFARVLIEPYARLLARSLAMPWLTLAVVVAVLIGSLGLVAGGRLQFVFFKAADSETVMVNLRMPIGTPIDRTDEIVRRLERAAAAQPEVMSVFAISGYTGDTEGSSQAVQEHLAQIWLELTPVEEREIRGERTSDQVIVAIREAAGELAGIKSLRMEGIQGGPEGPPISLAVTGEDEGAIRRAARAIQERLDRFGGVFDIADDADTGQRELRLTLRPGASELGFTPESVALQVRAAVYGLEPYTFPGNREDVDVRVRLPEATRRSLAAIERLHVFTPDGRPVPLGEVVELEEAQGYATVRRLDRRRAVTVTADVDMAVANPEEVMAAVAPDLERIEREIPGVRIVERGRQEDVADSFSTLPLGLLTAFGLIYVLLAWLLASYVQPLIIMTAIPFAIIGMVWGHILLGYELTMLSLIGFMALSGIVVNDSIVFMEFYNHRRRAGLGAVPAAYETGRARLRAILLTTITTVAGLGPLILENSFQARILIPMAITICFGLIASTVLVLVALPCLLVALDQVQRGVITLWRGERESPPAAGHAAAMLDPAER